MKRLLIKCMALALLVIAIGACGSTKTGCDGKKKQRVEMGWM